MKILLRFFPVFLIILSCNAQDTRYRNYDFSLPELIVTLELNPDNISILIDKSDHKLVLLADTAIIKEYPVVFGGNPVDDKLRQGDKCTPEGTFYMASKYPHKKWSKFIWINYPTDESWQKHNAAKQKGIIPGNSKIGGEIGIHGVPEGMDKLIDLGINWTLGCISMKNRDVNEIYPYISESTVIVIRK